ncbi:SAV_2336 N-terminal domain-related protein [Nocardia sp. NPDC019395]|uniref:SAV_2336 N-terminal domain-related protein n=1 Tax=Nocardia sp. NPDC019395 TaxID=3154686 RepID=UPI00340B6470
MSSLSELLDALRGLDVDGGTVAEALWLAKHIADQPGSDMTGKDALPDDFEPGTPPSATPDTGAVSHLLPRESPLPVPPGHTAAWPYRIEADMPAPSPLDSETNVLGELRPLARRIPDPHELIFDEEATVDRTARTAVAWPVTKENPVRRREAALVFDRHSSMAAWSGLADAVRNLVNTVGFRQVTVWYLDEDAAGAPRLATNPRGTPDRSLSVLSDPTGRRVIMVFTACLGDAWVSGAAAAELARLAAQSPVAIVQPLPSNLWRRTGLEWGHGRVTAVVPERPSPLRLIAPEDTAVIPVPVLELTPGWIRPWAQLLSGERRSAGYPLLRLPDPAAKRPRPLAVRQDEELGRNPLERVRRFRSASSPEAFRLAVSLAQVPLLPPIMRLVQQAVLPGSKRSVLAEVLAGGLIEDAGTGSAPPYTIPEDSRVFAFRPDVAKILRDALPRSEAAQVLAAASRFVTQHYDVPGRVFRAVVSHPSAGGSPFAYLSPETLRRIAPNFPDPPAEPPGADDEQRYQALVRAADEAMRLGDTDIALTAFRRALQTLPMGHAQRGGLLNGLTVLLRRRWEDSGNPGDLDEAIAVGKAALVELEDTDAGTATMAGLGELLLHRFEAVGGADFLTDATRVLRSAVEITGADDPGRAELSERLADALLRRCEITGDPLYAWEAVDLCLAAAESDTGEPDRGSVLMFKIARAYLDIATMSANPNSELEGQVIEYFRHAAGALPDEPGEAGTALLDTVTRAVRAVRTGSLPARFAADLSNILARVAGRHSGASLAEARRMLDSAGADDHRQ